jgi:hypothetical protein
VLTKFGYHSPDGGTTRTVHSIRYHRWAIAIVATSLVVINLHRGTLVPSNGSPSASITQGEAAPITTRSGGTTLQECMALWDAGTHMSKTEWKAACKRTMVLEFPANVP